MCSDQHKTDINDLLAELCDDKVDEGFNRSKITLLKLFSCRLLSIIRQVTS